MEDFQLDVVLGQGPSARTLRLDLPRFTLIGATTRTGLLTTPLRGRFGVLHRLDYYAADELGAIVRRSARLLDVAIDDDGAAALAERVARDAAHRQPAAAPGARRRPGARARRSSTGPWPRRRWSCCEVDALGLEELDRQILRRLAETFEGRPVGLGTLADSVGEAADTIEDVYEPYLLQEGLLKRTPRGRVATAAGVPPPGARPPRARWAARALLTLTASARGG